MADKSSDAPKKMKFVPKIPPRKLPRPAEPKRETPDDDDAVNEELLKRVKENFGRNGPKVDKKLAVEQVPSFGPSAARSHARSFGNPPRATSSSTAVGTEHQDGGGESLVPRVEKEYVDHWRYYSYYPSLLPLRRPYSGDPEILDEQEFGEASANADHDESRINPAEELGLMEEKNGEMLLFQLPASLPLVKRSASAKDKEKTDGSEPSTKEKTDGLEPSTKEAADSSKPSRRRGIPEKGCRLEELPAGFMGKMLVYKSGAVKMKLGDTLFDPRWTRWIHTYNSGPQRAWVFGATVEDYCSPVFSAIRHITSALHLQDWSTGDGGSKQSFIWSLNDWLNDLICLFRFSIERFHQAQIVCLHKMSLRSTP